MSVDGKVSYLRGEEPMSVRGHILSPSGGETLSVDSQIYITFGRGDPVG